jgi:ribosome-associated protein
LKEPPQTPVPAPEAGSLSPGVVRAADLALDKKAENVLALDLRGISSATDFFLVATGNSDIHVRAIAEHILEALAREGMRPLHTEGLDRARWVLLDFVDFVVHVFHPVTRDFYQLESLWGDAPTRVFPS